MLKGGLSINLGAWHESCTHPTDHISKKKFETKYCCRLKWRLKVWNHTGLGLGLALYPYSMPIGYQILSIWNNIFREKSVCPYVQQSHLYHPFDPSHSKKGQWNRIIKKESFQTSFKCEQDWKCYFNSNAAGPAYKIKLKRS